MSDSLYFTGTDLGDRRRGASRRRGQPSDHSEDDDEDVASSTSGDDDIDDYDLALLGPEGREEALVQTAMARIQRAQARGRADVSLTKEELGALERRKKRIEEESERRERKKRREHRIAVPLTHLDPVSLKNKSSPSALESSSRHSSGSDLGDAQERQTYPPLSSRTRPRSGTSASQRGSSRALDDRGSSPFHYEYVQRPASSAGRHVVSDSVARPRSSWGSPHDEGWAPTSSPPSSRSSRRNTLDPFQFQTAGPRASRRHASGSSDPPYPPGRDMEAPGAARSSHGSRRSVYGGTSDEGSEASTSDELNSGARIREPMRTRSEIIVEPELEPEPSRKKSSEVAPKRKPVPSRGRKKRK